MLGGRVHRRNRRRHGRPAAPRRFTRRRGRLRRARDPAQKAAVSAVTLGRNSVFATRRLGLSSLLRAWRSSLHNRGPSTSRAVPLRLLPLSKKRRRRVPCRCPLSFSGEVTRIGFAFASRRWSSEDVWRRGPPSRSKARANPRQCDRPAGRLAARRHGRRHQPGHGNFSRGGEQRRRLVVHGRAAAGQISGCGAAAGL